MLTAHELNILSKLPEDARQFVTAKFSKPIKDFSEYDLEIGCANIVDNTMDAYNPSTKDQTEVKRNIYSLLVKDLKRPKFTFIAFAEIEEACYRGVRKEFGDFFSPNISVINGWIDSYFKLKERHEALNQFTLLLKGEYCLTSDKPLHIKIEQSKAGVKRLFQQYKETGRLDMVSFAYYNTLVELVGVEYKGVKTLITDPEIRKRVTLEQTEKIKNKYLVQKEKSEKKGFLSESEAIMAKIINLDKDGEVHRRIKEEFLKIYFDELIKNNKELNFESGI